jgi:ribonuclease R
MTRHKNKNSRTGKKKNTGTSNPKDIQTFLFEYFVKNPNKRFGAKQLIKKLNLSNSKEEVQQVLDQLEKDKKIFPQKGDKYQLHFEAPVQSASNTYEGYVDITRSGAGYIVCDQLERDVYVQPKFLNRALHGDRVLIAVDRYRMKRPEGKVIKIIQRVTDTFIGTFKQYKNETLVVVDQGDHYFEVRIDPKEALMADESDKVVVKITQWADQASHKHFGTVTRVLGKEGSSDVEMQAILINHGFDTKFPEEVEREAAQLNGDVSEKELEWRRDIRDLTTFTIDPLTAKDFDDALSYRELENGDTEVGIHIADVSHYVQSGTALDKEAFRRSTSVYLVDRVAPMLPERLSNDLCSLRPDEDRRSFSALLVLDKQRRVKSRWFGKTLIHSDRRFTYEEAQAVLDAGEGTHYGELKALNELAYFLRKKRFSEGSIDFNSEETQFELDEDGTPIRVYVKERMDAHRLVEDLMLLANREVAKYIGKKENGQAVPFVYRVHDSPDPVKVAEFAAFAAEMGVKMQVDTPDQIARSYNDLSRRAMEDDRLRMLEPIAIRTMAKAVYTTDNIGHYGLAFDFYSHFTSPIRRYADVLVHRILEKNLTEPYRANATRLEEMCRHISNQERKAMDAERESIKYKQVEFIARHIGEELAGRISGMIDKGIFVELVESKAEGLIPFDRMDEPFTVAESRLKATGKRTGKVLKMGDDITVRVLDTDLSTRRIEFELV